MTQYNTKPDSLELLAKVANLELANLELANVVLIYQVRQEPQDDIHQEPRQVAIRLHQVKPQGIEDEDILNLLLSRIQHLEERQNSGEERMKYLEFDLHSKICQLEDERLEQDSLLFWR